MRTNKRHYIESPIDNAIAYLIKNINKQLYTYLLIAKYINVLAETCITPRLNSLSSLKTRPHLLATKKLATITVLDVWLYSA